MTALDVCQRTATTVGITRPPVVFTGITTASFEMRDLLRECADMIAKAHPWQALSKEGSFTGDGTTTAFDLPSDYGWLRQNAEMRTNQQIHPLLHIQNSDDWLAATTNSLNQVFNAWHLFGGRVQFYPALSSGEVVRFHYQGNQYVRGVDGTLKAEFTADNDSFILDERLLRLCMKWRYAEQKGIVYAEDMATYEEALSQAISRDRGPWEHRGGKGVFSRVPEAYPWRLG